MKIKIIFLTFLFFCQFAGAWGISEETLLDLSQEQMMHRSLTTLHELLHESTDSAKKYQSQEKSPLHLGRLGLTLDGELSKTSGVSKLALSLYPREEYVPRYTDISRLLKAFHKNAEKIYGIPSNHLATAMTVAIVGGWTAYTGLELKNEWIKPLFHQLDRVMRMDEAITQASVSKKVHMHQLLAGMGLIFTAEVENLKSMGNDARSRRLREMGGKYLKALLGVPPDKIVFSSSGMKFK